MKYGSKTRYSYRNEQKVTPSDVSNGQIFDDFHPGTSRTPLHLYSRACHNVSPIWENGGHRESKRCTLRLSASANRSMIKKPELGLNKMKSFAINNPIICITIFRD